MLPSGSTTTYSFEPRGLLTSVTDPFLHATTYVYDAAGQRISMTDRRNNTTSYGYDAAGRMTSMTDALGGVVGFAFDAAWQVTGRTDPNNQTWTFTYDTLGNQLTETDPLGRVQSTTYDLLGQVTSTTDARNTTVGYSYDANGNLTDISYPGGSVSYDYDVLNRRTDMTDTTGITSWTYDAAGQATAVTSSNEVVSYGYDAAGRRSTMTLPGSRSFTYSYDAAGQTSSVTDWLNATITFGYDTDGNRTSINRPSGVTSTYTYNAAGWVNNIDHSGQACQCSLQSFAYTYDAEGNRTSVTTPAGTESYTLDALNRLTDVTYANGDTEAFTYDPAGNRLTHQVNGVQVASNSYDAAGQLLSDGTTSYGYDAVGNLTTAGADSYTWDWNNRLTSATVNGTTETYTYDGDGVRLGSTTGGTTTGYLWDRLGGVDLLLDDGAQVYLNIDGSLAQIDDAGTTRHHLTDGPGSVRGLSDAAGQLSGTANYSAFGEVRDQTGDTSLLGFTGEQHDATTGNIYLRSRYADPSLGRLLSADTVQPNAPGSQGYNRYSYVANNPTTWIDPTGHVAAAAGIALSPAWPQIAAFIALIVIADCALQSPLGICSAIATFLITAFVTLACVLGGFEGACYTPGAIPNDPRPWWEENRKWDVPLPWIPSIPIPFTNAGEDARAEPVAPPFPLPRPSPNDPCLDPSSDWAKLWLALKTKGLFGIGRASARAAMELGEMWVGPGWRMSSDGKAMISKDGLRQFRLPSQKRSGKWQANFEWRSKSGGRWEGGNGHLDIDNSCP